MTVPVSGIGDVEIAGVIEDRIIGKHHPVGVGACGPDGYRAVGRIDPEDFLALDVAGIDSPGLVEGEAGDEPRGRGDLFKGALQADDIELPGFAACPESSVRTSGHPLGMIESFN